MGVDVDVDRELTDDELKFEIITQLGLLPKVEAGGLRSLSSKESGRVGGLMAKRRRESKRS